MTAQAAETIEADDAALEHPATVRDSLERSVFPIAGAWLLAMTIWGFGGTFRYIPNPSGLPLLIKLHGLAFFAWPVLFVIQASLARTGRAALHRRLGIAAFVVLATMIPTGYGTILRAITLDRRTATEGLLLLTTLTIGFSYALLAIRYRHRDAARHARAMLFATVMLTSLSIDRASFLAGVSDRPWLVLMVRGMPCAAVLAIDLLHRNKTVCFDCVPLALLIAIDIAWMLLPG
jgi:hypothetical protein